MYNGIALLHTLGSIYYFPKLCKQQHLDFRRGVTISIYILLTKNNKRIYHNATKHGHSTKLLHK